MHSILSMHSILHSLPQTTPYLTHSLLGISLRSLVAKSVSLTSIFKKSEWVDLFLSFRRKPIRQQFLPSSYDTPLCPQISYQTLIRASKWCTLSGKYEGSTLIYFASQYVTVQPPSNCFVNFPPFFDRNIFKSSPLISH